MQAELAVGSYNGTSYTTLNDPLGISTGAVGIDGNNIVGWYAIGTQNYHGFLYNGTSYTTVDDPLAKNGGGTALTRPTASAAAISLGITTMERTTTGSFTMGPRTRPWNDPFGTSTFPHAHGRQ